MVLQHGSIVALYGKTIHADSDLELRVSPKSGSSFSVPVNTTSADEIEHAEGGANYSGIWKAYIDPLPAGGSYDITVSCKSGCASNDTSRDTHTLSRITFGDVYYCSGQSNSKFNLIVAINRSRLGLVVLIKWLWSLCTPSLPRSSVQRLLQDSTTTFDCISMDP
jgi:hypothetical protein